MVTGDLREGAIADDAEEFDGLFILRGVMLLEPLTDSAGAPQGGEGAANLSPIRRSAAGPGG